MNENTQRKNIPPHLLEKNQWVCFKILHEENVEHDRKLPINPLTGYLASSTDPETWGSYEQAIQGLDIYECQCVAYALKKEDNLVFIDLDKAIVNGTPTDLAKEILNQFEGTYTELSQSGTGYHILCSGNLKANRRTTKTGSVTEIEMYDQKRFMILTGHVIGTNLVPDKNKEANELYDRFFKDEKPPQFMPTQLYLEDQEIIEKILRQKNSDKFERIFKHADLSDYQNNNSQAELALANFISFYTKDHSQIERIIQSSAHFDQKRMDKWTKNSVYPALTINKAISNSGTYDPNYNKPGQKKEPGQKNCPDLNNNFFSTIQEIMASKPTSNWLINKFLQQNSLALIFGEPGSFKTFAVIDMGLCIAAGKEWAGYKTKQGPVFYLAGEGRGGIDKRIQAWCQHNEIIDPKFPFFVSNHVTLLNEDEQAELLVNHINALEDAHGKPSLIVVDTLSRHNSGDENSSKDMAVFVEKVGKYLLSKKCCVLLVHHTGLKDKKRARGSSTIKGALDWEYNISAINGGFELKNTKVKDEDAPPPLYFTKKIIELPYIDPDTNEHVTSCVLEKSASLTIEKTPKKLKLNDAQDTMMNILTTVTQNGNEGVLKDEFRELCLKSKLSSSGSQESNRKAFNRNLPQLIEKGLIEIDINDDYKEEIYII